MAAYYSPLEDRIIGAAKGTLVYWHERGHQYLHRRFSYYLHAPQFERALLVVLFLWLAYGRQDDAKLGAWVLLAFYIWDEIFAWLYAFAHVAPFHGKKA